MLIHRTLFFCLLLLVFWSISCLGWHPTYAAISVPAEGYLYNSAMALTPTPSPRLQQQADQLKEEGNQLAGEGDFAGALDKYQAALPLYRQARDRSSEAQVILNIGLSNAYLQEYQLALDYYDQALTLWRAVESPIKEADTLVNIALVYAEMGDYQRVTAPYVAALAIFQETDEVHKTAFVLNGLGDTYYAVGNYEQALTYLEEAETLWRTLQDRANAAETSRQIKLIEQLTALENEQKFYAQLLAESSLSLARSAGGLSVNNDHAGAAELVETPSPDNDPETQAAALFEEGWQRFEDGQLEAALAKFETVLALYRPTLEQSDEAFCLLAIGFVKAELSDYVGALAAYQESLPIYQALNDQLGEVTTRNNIGLVYDNLGQYQAALDAYEPALALYQTLGNREGEGIVLNNMGSVYRALGQYERALENFIDALALAEETADRKGEGITHNNIGGVYRGQGKYKDALGEYEKALDIFQVIDDQAQQATTLNNMGAIYGNQGHYTDALDTYARALAIFQTIEYPVGEATTLNNIGDVLQNIGDYESASTQYAQALAIFQTIGYRAGEVTTLSNQGTLYRARGQYQQALDRFNQALAIADELQHQATLILVRNNIGAVYEDQSRYEAALVQYQAVLTTAKAIGEQANLGGALNNLGSVRARLGQYQTAEENLVEALEIRQEIGDQRGQVSTLINLGSLDSDLTPTDSANSGRALKQYEQAFDLAQRIGDLPDAAIALNNIGIVYGVAGEPQLALTAFQELRTLWTDLSNRAGEAVALNNMGAAYTASQEYQEALAAFDQALAIFVALADPTGQAATLGYLGYLYESQGQSREAIDYYKQAIDQVESVQGDIRVDVLKITFADQQVNLYERLIKLLWTAQRGDEAFAYAERARARAFLDQIGNQQVDSRKDADPELIEQEQRLRQEIIGLQNSVTEGRLGNPDESHEDIQAKLEQARRDYAELLTQLKLHSPDYAALVSVDTLSLRQVQRQVLDEETTMIEYFVTDEYTLAWIIDHNRRNLVQLNVTRDDLANSVEFIVNALKAQDVTEADTALLYNSLIAPLIPYIQHPNLVIVPHDVLHYLPFAALWDGEHEAYLLEQYTLTYAPSASALRFLETKPTANINQLLAFANSADGLTHVVDEVEAIAAIYDVNPYIDAQATETLVYTQAGEANLLHFATHGVYDKFNPLFTRIELTADGENDGNLEVHEVFGLDLQNANLVVLSACETAIGERSRGDDITGLTRAFLYARTPAIVTTLWQIDDEATTELMVKLYEQLHNGEPLAAALQAAQLAILAEEEWHSPYYWAAFTLHGKGNSYFQSNTD